MKQKIIVCIVGMLMCASSLVALTWAWFSTNITSATGSIEAGSYELVVTVTNNNDEPVNAVNGVYTLNAGDAYKVTVRAIGTATVGYCKIVNAEDTTVTLAYTEHIFTTADINEPSQIEFNLILDNGGKICFVSRWGSYDPQNKVIISSGIENTLETVGIADEESSETETTETETTETETTETETTETETTETETTETETTETYTSEMADTE